MDQFKHYLEQIPDNIYNNAKIYAGKHIALLMPKDYISDVSIVTEDYHIIIPIESPPPIIIDKKEYEFAKNKIVLINPDVKAYCKKNESVTSRYSAITIKKQFLNDVAKDMDFHQTIRFSNVGNPFSNNIRCAIYDFKQEIENYGNSCSMLIDSLSIRIAATILREMKSNFNTTNFCYTAGEGYVKNAQAFMREFYSTDISISDICSEIHITPYHFIRLFKASTGNTPYEYLLNLRIDKAKEMITVDDDNIMIISKKCGFVNNAHFSTTFKRLTGVSPIEYKRNNIKKY